MPERNPDGRAQKKSRLPRVTITEIENVQARCLSIVNKNMDRVQEVLDGKRQWSNQQLKLFQICLNKVAPDVSASQVTIDKTVRHVHELTEEQLMAIAAGAAKADEPELIDITPEVSDPDLARALDAVEAMEKSE